MATITISKEKIEKQKGVVVLPLADYEAIKEEIEMFRSKKLAKDIKKAREEVKRGRVVNFVEIKRRLRLV